MKRWMKWLLVLLVLLALAAGVMRALQARKVKQQALEQSTAARAQQVLEFGEQDIVQVQNRQLRPTLPISGTVKAAQTVVIKARVAGELQELALREGDPVQKGQAVARVEPSETRYRLRQAQEQADAARSQIDLTQRQYDNNLALVKQGFISKTALDASQANLNAANASHKAALAAVDLAQKTQDDATLYSPIKGLVAQRLAQPGERVAVDARLLEIVDLSRLEFEAVLDPAVALQVRVGQEAVLRIEGSDLTLNAKVLRISPSTQAGSRGVLVYLSLPTAAGLRHGMFAQGHLLSEPKSALTLPLSAVRTDKPQPYVQAIQDRAVVHLPVRIGLRQEAMTGQDTGAEAAVDTWVAVQDLAEGTVVLRGSVGPLRAGQAIRANTAGR